MAKEKHADTETRSPFAGCAIFIVAGVILLGLVAWSLWALYSQSKAIADFTDPHPKPTLLLNPAAQPEKMADFQTRLSRFHEVQKSGEAATLTLSAEDLNFAIASFERFKELRETFYVRSIEEGKILANIHFALGSSFFTDRENHLNAQVVFTPALVDSEPVLKVEEIQPSRGEVPTPFLEHISPYRVMERYAEDDEILSPIFQKLTRVEIDGNNLVVVVDPDAEPIELSEEEVGMRTKHGVIVFMSVSSVILALVALALVLGKRKKNG